MSDNLEIPECLYRGPLPRAEWAAQLRAQNEDVERQIKVAAAAPKPEPSRARARDDAGDGGAPRFAKDQLKAFVERIERLHEEKKAISDDLADIYREAKGAGFHVKPLRAVIRLRAQDAGERKEEEAILETYLHALGMRS